MRTALVLALAALAGGCSRGSSDPGPIAEPHQQPEPPPGTGVQQIVMDGAWFVADVERTDGGSQVPNLMASMQPFLPVHVGQVLQVTGGRLRDAAGLPLYEPGSLDDEDFYANTSDGRVLWFDVFDFDPALSSQLAVQAIFGSSGDDEMIGFVSVMLLGAPMQGQFVSADVNGSFRVRVQRL